MRARTIRLLGIGALALVAALVPLAPVSADHGSMTVQATVRVFPMVVTLAVEPATVAVGERFTLRAEVRNLSSQNLQKGVASVTFDPASVELRGPVDGHFGAVNNRRTKTVDWSFLALKPGTVGFDVQVGAFDQEAQTLIAKTESVTVTIDAPPVPTPEGAEPAGPREAPPVPPGFPDFPTPPWVLPDGRRDG